MKWPLWFGMVFPVGILHLITWLLLLASPLIITKRSSGSPSFLRPWLKEAAAFGLILILFEVAWGIQLSLLSTNPSVATSAALQAVFVAVSACLGLTTFLYFCFLQPRDMKHRQLSAGESSSSCRDTTEASTYVEPLSPISKSSGDTVEVISLPNFADESEKIVIKLADL